MSTNPYQAAIIAKYNGFANAYNAWAAKGFTGHPHYYSTDPLAHVLEAYASEQGFDDDEEMFESLLDTLEENGYSLYTEGKLPTSITLL